MEKIEFDTEVKFGDKIIDGISVSPLGFMDLAKVWRKVASMPGKQASALQRERIRHQAHFTVKGERVIPDHADLHQLPLAVARRIIDALDLGQGDMGEVISEGDGITAPVHIRLGTPIEMKDAKGKAVKVSELEFIAKTYGEVEDVLAAENDMARTVALLTDVASPVEVSMPRLPGWALDKITTADGLLVMRKVLPLF